VLFSARLHGITLVEILVVLALMATTLTLATPYVSGLRDVLRLKGAVASLTSDLQLARTEASLRNTPVRWSWHAHPQGGCYILHTGQRSQCQCAIRAARCEQGAVALRSVHWPTRDRVILQPNVQSISFDPALGTSTPAARLRLSTPQGETIDNIINVMGRVRTCSAPHNRLGLPEC
jgi:type IV fimbrial biogenesis protein FimT